MSDTVPLHPVVTPDFRRRRTSEEARRSGRHAISVASVTGLRLGVEKRYGDDAERRAEATEDLDRLRSRFEILPLTRPEAIDAAEIIVDLQRRGEPLHDRHDVYIGATARTERLTALTANVDHFDRMDGVRVVDRNGF